MQKLPTHQAGSMGRFVSEIERSGNWVLRRGSSVNSREAFLPTRSAQVHFNWADFRDAKPAGTKRAEEFTAAARGPAEVPNLVAKCRDLDYQARRAAHG